MWLYCLNNQEVAPMSDALIEAAPGLANIVVADTAIGDVRGD